MFEVIQKHDQLGKLSKSRKPVIILIILGFFQGKMIQFNIFSSSEWPSYLIIYPTI